MKLSFILHCLDGIHGESKLVALQSSGDVLTTETRLFRQAGMLVVKRAVQVHTVNLNQLSRYPFS